jgi:hypothetical protein
MFVALAFVFAGSFAMLLANLLKEKAKENQTLIMKLSKLSKRLNNEAKR